MNNMTFPNYVAARTLALLDQKKARLDPMQTSFYVWQRPDRIVVVFDPTTIDIGKVNADFAHRLSTQLQGRRVVRTNSRGLFLQVGYEIPPALVELTSMPLDLSKQPTPYHIPIGATAAGRDLWVSILEGDSFLVAGSRSMGKTGCLHSMIQALQHGGQVEVYAFDGKDGVEFARYIGQPKFHYVTSLKQTLDELKAIANERRKALLASGQPNILKYNETHPDEPLLPIVLIVDEAALTSDDEKAGLVEIVERERATGFYPILATNRPEQSALLVKSNLVTRICFPVPSFHASQMVLGQNGAESLPKVQGRGLIVFKARVMEFQTFRVTYPPTSEDTVRMVLSYHEQAIEQVPTVADEITQLAESIREKWDPTMSKRAVGRMIGQTYAGAWARKIDQILDYLAATTATATTAFDQNSPQKGFFEAVAE
jgi:hypothetical protein